MSTRIYVRVVEDDAHGLEPGWWGLPEDVTAQQVVAYLRTGGPTPQAAIERHDLVQHPRIVVTVERDGVRDAAEWSS